MLITSDEQFYFMMLIENYVFRLNLCYFLWFIIAQSYNSVARTSRVGKWKLQITCDEKKSLVASPLVIFFHHAWFAIFIFQLVRFVQHYICCKIKYLVKIPKEMLPTCLEEVCVAPSIILVGSYYPHIDALQIPSLTF